MTSTGYAGGELTSCELLVCVVGGADVGKSSLLVRFVEDKFTEGYKPPLPEEEFETEKLVDADTWSCSMFFLDTPEAYDSMMMTYMRAARGFLLIYSITSHHSFEQVPTHKENALMIKDKESIPLVLVGNKSDLEQDRQVTFMEAAAFAKEVSAKTGNNVRNAFIEILREANKFGVLMDPPPRRRRRTECCLS